MRSGASALFWKKTRPEQHTVTQRSSATFAIPWSQTEIDGTPGAPLSDLCAGAVWRWHGPAIRLDDRSPVLRLGAAADADRRRRAARFVARLAGIAAEPGDIALDEDGHTLTDDTVALTDGRSRFVIGLVALRPGAPPLIVAAGDLPPQDTDLWVVGHARRRVGRAAATRVDGAMPGLASGTRIATPAGPVAVDHLREGDSVMDASGQAHLLLWIGRRHLGAAQLRLRPDLRPVRIAPGARGGTRPHAPLRVAPGQRLVSDGAVARTLFNADAVLVMAGHLLDAPGFGPDLQADTVTYHGLFLARHAVLRAEGLDIESLHPADRAIAAFAPEDRARFAARWPALMSDPQGYGPPVHRWLAPGEAAILSSRAA